ncbi:MAG: protein kinase [bacterium]|nr:protein kinase [bacterium]
MTKYKTRTKLSPALLTIIFPVLIALCSLTIPAIEAPSHGMGAPSHGVGAPSHGMGAPSHGVRAPSHGVGAPSHGVGAPSHEVGAPSHGVGIPSQGRDLPSAESTVPPLQKDPGNEDIETILQQAAKIYDKDPSKCISLCRQVLDMLHETDNRKARAEALFYLCQATMVKGDLEKALRFCNESLDNYRIINDKPGMADAMNALGMLYINIDYLNTAQGYLLDALKIRENSGNKAQLSASYLHLGILYYNLEDFSKALQYYSRALNLSKTLKAQRAIMVCLYYTGLCYQKLQKNEQAIDYLHQGLDLAKKRKHQYYIAAFAGNLGDIYGNRKQYAKALEHLQQARSIQETHKFKGALVYTAYYTGNVYLQLKDYSQFHHNYKQTLKLAKELKDKKTLERVYKKYAFFFASQGDYKQAFAFHKKYSETREWILNENKTKQIAELEIRFDAEKRQKELELLRKDNKIQKVTRNAFFIVLVLLSIILVLVFKKYLYLLAFWKMHKYIWQYRILEKIGSGGMGTVYRAHAVSDKTHMAAIKVLREELWEDEESRLRFKQEGMIIDKLAHPHIVKIFERGEHKGKLYIAMEYLRGITLARKIKEETHPDLTECYSIMIQIAEALAFIHSKDVVHRDIKPSNIMLVPGQDRTHLVKLLDFGVALMKFQTRLTQSGVLVGTISYTAPEQITDNCYSSAGDVYSLGITFYEMLTGDPAFRGETITAVVEKIIDQLPDEPTNSRPDIPVALNRLIMQMLCKDPDRRPTSTRVLEELKLLPAKESHQQ